MFSQLPYFAALIATTIAVPLNSHSLSSSSTRNQCRGTLASLDALRDDGDLASPEDENSDEATEMPPDRFMMKRFKLDSCETQEVQPAVRLSAFPDSGTTWLQYLLEEATKVATQNPKNIMLHHGETGFSPGDPVACRAECGAQIYLHPNCTAGSKSANNVTLSRGTTPEIFKTHYPDFTLRDALFETGNKIQTTILLVRNPLDAYLASLRHKGAVDASKVADVSPLGVVGAVPAASLAGVSKGCSAGFKPMRKVTKGRGIDPLHVCKRNATAGKRYTKFLRLWCRFHTFWLTNPSVSCTDVTVVRYEDLARITGDVLETVLHEAGLPTWKPEGINRSVVAFPPDDDRLSYNIYFNKTLHANDTIQRWALTAVNRCEDRVKELGYMSFLQDVLENVTLENVTVYNGTTSTR